MGKPIASGKIKKKPWTEGRTRAFIMSVLRAGMLKYPPKYEALFKARVGKKFNQKTKREGMHYKCYKCKREFPASEVQVDHRKPVVDPRKGFTNWDDYITRLFCVIRNLQVLCTKCHGIKTLNEKKRRKHK